MEKYVYEHLLGSEQFRVLILSPDARHAPVKCSLETLFVGPAKQEENAYEALSYAWGSQNNKVDILCDGRKLSITQQLETALKHLRDEEVPRRLWIDQICINQENLDERGAQVKMMAAIYSSARRVVVWLGEASQTTHLAIKFATELCEALTALAETYKGQIISLNDFGEILKPKNFYLPKRGESEWISLSELLSRRWFERLWVVQEVLMNENIIVQCGNEMFTWELMEELEGHFSRQLALEATLLPLGKASGDTWRGSYAYNGPPTPGPELLHRIRYAKCHRHSLHFHQIVQVFTSQEASDPRDFIYGLLSAAPHSEAALISPDYRKTTSDVYTDFARVMIKKFELKSLLNRVALDRNSDIKVPSWVPNWATNPGNGGNCPIPMNSALFRASKLYLGVWELTDDAQILRVKGRQVGCLEDTGVHMRRLNPNHTDEDEIKFGAQSMLNLSDFVIDAMALARLCDFYSKESSRASMLALTCCRENFRAGDFATAEEVTKAFIGLYDAALSELRALNFLLQEESSWWMVRQWQKVSRTMKEWHVEWKGQRDFIQALEQATSDCAKYFIPNIQANRIVRTDSGLLANVTWRCEVGDIIAIVYGCNTPFLLRPVSTGYLLVGECYVYGLMDGEAIENDVGEEMEFALV